MNKKKVKNIPIFAFLINKGLLALFLQFNLRLNLFPKNLKYKFNKIINPIWLYNQFRKFN